MFTQEPAVHAVDGPTRWPPQGVASCMLAWFTRPRLQHLADYLSNISVHEFGLLWPSNDHEHPAKTALDPVLQGQAVNPAARKDAKAMTPTPGLRKLSLSAQSTTSFAHRNVMMPTE